MQLTFLVEGYGVYPQSYRDALTGLAKLAGLEPGCIEDLGRLASLKNLLVHRYWEIDDALIHESARRDFRCVEELLSRIEDADRVVEALREAGRRRVRALIIFGSTVRGRPARDVDLLLVAHEEPGLRDLLDLEGELEKAAQAASRPLCRRAARPQPSSRSHKSRDTRLRRR